MRFGSAIKDKPFGESYSGESSDYLRTFKEGQSLVRFVYPLSADGWIGYYEHNNPTTKRSPPCLEILMETLQSAARATAITKTSAMQAVRWLQTSCW